MHKEWIKAKHNKNNHFNVFELSEYFNDSLVLFKSSYPWFKINNLSHENVGNYKKRPLSKGEIGAIESFNELDIELYNWAKDKLWKRYNKNYAENEKNKTDLLKLQPLSMKKITLFNGIYKRILSRIKNKIDPLHK
jgi:hypothetical protein